MSISSLVRSLKTSRTERERLKLGRMKVKTLSLERKAAVAKELRQEKSKQMAAEKELLQLKEMQRQERKAKFAKFTGGIRQLSPKNRLASTTFKGINPEGAKIDFGLTRNPWIEQSKPKKKGQKEFWEL